MFCSLLAHHTLNLLQLCSKEGHGVLGTLHPAPCQMCATSLLQQKKLTEVKHNRAPVLSHGALSQPGHKVGMVASQFGQHHSSCSPLPQDHRPPQSVQKQELSKRFKCLRVQQREDCQPTRIDHASHLNSLHLSTYIGQEKKAT